MWENYKFIEKYLSGDNTKQNNSFMLLKKIIGYYSQESVKLLDLGCGTGHTKNTFKNISPAIYWVGLDISDSPEVQARYSSNNNIVTYDGEKVPFMNNSFDIVYTNQVFEHVRDPKTIISEINRILKPGGYLVGSVSQLEPYHSNSIFNITIYGICYLLNLFDLELKEIRPGVDCVTIILNRACRGLWIFRIWFTKESPVNIIITALGRMARLSNEKINLVKLIFCGHICFISKKKNI
jgi:SAM-dependent methyltransferase